MAKVSERKLKKPVFREKNYLLHKLIFKMKLQATLMTLFSKSTDNQRTVEKNAGCASGS